MSKKDQDLDAQENQEQVTRREFSKATAVGLSAAAMVAMSAHALFAGGGGGGETRATMTTDTKYL